MTPSEAATVLQLNPNASTQEIESHFLQLRSALEEKAAKALTPRLRARYEGALAEVTAAYETLVLASDAKTLPTLKRAQVAPSQPPMAKPPKPGSFPELGRQIVGMIKGAAAAGLGLLTLATYALLAEDTGFEAPGPDFDGGFTFIMGFIALVVLPGLFVWHAFVRKAANLPTRTTHYVLAVAGFAVAGLSGVTAYQVRTRPAPVAASPAPVAEPTIEQPPSASALVAEGLNYREGENGLAKDEAKAVERFQRAADLGSRDGMHFLAMCYELGIGVPQNLELALKWHQAAADLGEPFSVQAIERVKSALAPEYTRLAEQSASIELNNRAVEFWVGENTPKNSAKAVELWREAAAKGSREAMWGLGLAYEQGTGVSRDPATASQWFEQAASLGLEDAIEKLKQRPEQATPVTLAVSSGQTADRTTSAETNQVPIGSSINSSSSSGRGRVLQAPSAYSMLKPTDVWFGFNWENKYVNGEWQAQPGEISLASMRLSPGNTFSEASNHRAQWWGGSASLPETVKRQGSELNGGIVTLGWTAWVYMTNDWWPPPSRSGHPGGAAGWAYGAATLDGAIEVAFRSAHEAFKAKHPGRKIVWVTVEAGVSAQPDYARYQQVIRSNGLTFSVWTHCALPFSWGYSSPSRERDAQEQNWNKTIPSDPLEFVRFVRKERQDFWRRIGQDPTQRQGMLEIIPWWDGQSEIFTNIPVAGMPPPEFFD